MAEAMKDVSASESKIWSEYKSSKIFVAMGIMAAIWNYLMPRTEPQTIDDQ